MTMMFGAVSRAALKNVSDELRVGIDPWQVERISGVVDLYWLLYNGTAANALTR